MTASFFSNLRTQDPSAAVTLVLNEESVRLTAAQFTGKTLSQLFAEYGRGLVADQSRIQSFAVNNTVVPSDTQVRPGETVRAIIKAEGKGAA